MASPPSIDLDRIAEMAQVAGTIISAVLVVIIWRQTRAIARQSAVLEREFLRSYASLVLRYLVAAHRRVERLLRGERFGVDQCDVVANACSEGDLGYEVEKLALKRFLREYAGDGSLIEDLCEIYRLYESGEVERARRLAEDREILERLREAALRLAEGYGYEYTVAEHRLMKRIEKRVRGLLAP